MAPIPPTNQPVLSECPGQLVRETQPEQQIKRHVVENFTTVLDSNTKAIKWRICQFWSLRKGMIVHLLIISVLFPGLFKGICSSYQPIKNLKCCVWMWSVVWDSSTLPSGTAHVVGPVLRKETDFLWFCLRRKHTTVGVVMSSSEKIK